VSQADLFSSTRGTGVLDLLALDGEPPAVGIRGHKLDLLRRRLGHRRCSPWETSEAGAVSLTWWWSQGSVADGGVEMFGETVSDESWNFPR
jgi:hypothetical protein